MAFSLCGMVAFSHGCIFALHLSSEEKVGKGSAFASIDSPGSGWLLPFFWGKATPAVWDGTLVYVYREDDVGVVPLRFDSRAEGTGCVYRIG